MLLKGKEFVEHSSGLFVSRDGEIFVLKSITHPQRFSYGNDNGEGYRVVWYKEKYYKVHRLVAECFLDNPNNYPTVDHINRVRDNNRVENLRWADYSLQNTNKEKYIRRNNPKNIASSKKVLQLTMDGQLVKEWPSMMECQRNGFNQSNVWKCCNGKLNQHKGYKWKYSE